MLPLHALPHRNRHKTFTRRLKSSLSRDLSSLVMQVLKLLTGSRFSNDEFHAEIAFRLSNYHFAMSSRHAIPLVRCFERKDTYKAWGATYNADAKQWYFLPGTDLRGLLQYQPSWLQNPELLRREILMRLISEIEHNPTLVR